MASFNRLILMGNITRDLDLRYTPNGTAVLDVGLAVNDRHRNSEGKTIDSVVFIDCVCFGRTAEVCNEYLQKGSPVFFEGRLKLDTWEKEGERKSKHKMVVERMQLVGGPPRGGSGASSNPTSHHEERSGSYQSSNEYSGEEYPAAPF
jgi:single-strand DNA-binding protein